ncbi:MAG: DUF1553 domain-containing protein [Planctomycetia bacterium]|nr:DUF1553 domain-containing protein [Planctomycetia bacterium]
MRTQLWLSLCLLASSSGVVRAAELQLQPADVALTGPGATQRMLAVAVEGKQVVGDRTGQAKFTSSNPAVANVTESGVVQAVGDGVATITAAHEGQQASAKVKVTKTQEPAAESFRNQIIPILTRNGCNSGACHGALAGKGGLKLSLRGYDPEADHFALTRQAGARRIDRQEPAKSLLLRKATLTMDHGGGLKIEANSRDFQVLADWIAHGAPGLRADEPRIQRLEVFPAAATLKPTDGLQIVVRAWYSDGRSTDVTRWAKFSSSEELVAKVDEHGQVKVAGHGEAAIVVWYSDLVAASQITSPFAGSDRLEQQLAQSPRHNYIDELVLAKLRALRIPPSGVSNDEEFIRRAFLDAAGILPTPDEVEKFLADSAADKRARLIDALLQRPEFVDYWTYKWSDMLLVSTRRLPQPAAWSFYQFVRQSVASNKPWDRFARDILTASGSNLQNGAANYFVLHKDVTDLTETTAVTFLGMSITCARCHNHPLEKWTQDQYWGMASLFARVAIKNGDRSGEVTVQAQPSGDIPHPRRGEAMPPTPLDAKPLAASSVQDRRAYFADWLTAPENPYFAKALVNRVWRNFMGRALVEAEDDLRQTNPPSNPALFDALAKDFTTHQYDVKHLIRAIMNSAAYQRSSKPLPENAADDRFYSRYLIRRLSAEVILDAYSQVTKVPTPFNQVLQGTAGGFNNYAGYPLGTRALQLPDAQVVSQFLDSFGRPDRSVACSCERQQDSSVGQALHINNGKTLNDKLRAKGSRLDDWLTEKIDDEEAVRRIFLLALCRKPTPAEQDRVIKLMQEAAAAQAPRREVLEDLVWSVLSGKEFLFNR